MPGPFEFEGIKPSLRDGADLQRKIQLLEGDRSAYYESSQSAIKKNKDVILQLRQENKRLHKKLADALTGDEQVIKDAFQSRGMEIAPFRNKSGKAALQILDQKVCDRMKKLNALRHSAETRRRRLEELQQQYDSIQAQAQAPQHSGPHLCPGRERTCAVPVCTGHCTVFSPSPGRPGLSPQDESLTFQSQLDRLEAEILRQRQELQDLQVMKNDANLSKDVARAELQRQEELVYKERRERDGILACYKKQAEELKAHSERLERRAQRTAMHPDELSSEAQRSAAAVAEEDKVIHTFEEAFHRIKEATGVTDTHEVVERFISQGDTQKHLEKLKEENERTLVQLKEERDQLQAQFQELKYSGEAKLSSGQQMVEECEGHLQREQEKRDEASERLEALTRTLNAVRAGVDHLSDKLQHIKMKGKPSKTQVSPSSDEYALELLTQSELRLASLVDLLQGKDLAAILKEMEEEEFQTSIEGKLPQYNMRIQLPERRSRARTTKKKRAGTTRVTSSPGPP
ncbi:hypothetical protein ANANG_G00031040 [Anguilla anguilla]|uniref:ODAD1 central coiled coil region domain-containing protein n=1 Tax=Anguilla anguilla TaxID=7936 RepID=A0A9D3S8I1_ANGAN|nr:hypothetical protein ANANG_G00031040 [Anguilla anguilla]